MHIFNTPGGLKTHFDSYSEFPWCFPGAAAKINIFSRKSSKTGFSGDSELVLTLREAKIAVNSLWIEIFEFCFRE